MGKTRSRKDLRGGGEGEGMFTAREVEGRGGGKGEGGEGKG